MTLIFVLSIVLVNASQQPTVEHHGILRHGTPQISIIQSLIDLLDLT